MRSPIVVVLFSVLACGGRKDDGGDKASYYGPCTEEEPCEPDEDFCVLGADARVCGKTCQSDEDCPSSPEGTPMCVAEGCELVCEGDDDCPEGMSCSDTTCVWPVEPGGESCGDPGTHSHIVDPGNCFCDDGYDWCAPDDPDDYSCCASNFEPCTSGNNNHLDPNGQCVCDLGFDWCTQDPDDLDCCISGGN